MLTATLAPDGRYDLSEMIAPFGDDLSFDRLALYARGEPEARGTWVYGICQDGAEHPAPILHASMVLEPASALAVLGYTIETPAG